MTDPNYRPTITPEPNTEWDIDQWATNVTKSLGEDLFDGIGLYHGSPFDLLAFRFLRMVVGVLYYNHETGEIRIWVHEDFRHMGVGTHLMLAAYERFQLKAEGQSYTADGAAFVQSFIERKRHELED